MFKFITPLLVLGLLVGCGSSSPRASAPASTPLPPADPLVGIWKQGNGHPGLNGYGAQVTAMVKDSQGNLIAGGYFDDAAGTPVSNVALWDGKAWHAMGDGLPGGVNALLRTSTGEIYAGGSFATASTSNYLAKWNGTTWVMDSTPVNGQIMTLAQQGSRILVGGQFSLGGVVAARNLAAYQDGTWTNLGDPGGEVDTLLVTGEQTFAIGGMFWSVGGNSNVSCVAAWDGTAWTNLGVDPGDWNTPGLPGQVYTLVKGPDGRIYAGGSFAMVIDPMNWIASNCLAVLDEAGLWQPFQRGVDHGSTNVVQTLAFTSNGDMLVGGCFNTAGYPYTAARSFARFRKADQTWVEEGAGVDAQVGVATGAFFGVKSLLVNADDPIFFGGSFSNSGDQTQVAANIAKLEGKKWTALADPAKLYRGVAGSIYSFTRDAGGDLIAGGVFPFIGGTSVNNVARRKQGTQTWETVGFGLDGTVNVVHASANGTLYAGGTFWGSGETYAPNLAKFDGKAWAPLTTDLLNDAVQTIIDDGKGGLYVGGAFTLGGGTLLNHVAHWNGATWEPMGAGFSGRVNALLMTPAGLVATGSFANSGSQTLNGIALWKDGAWMPLGVSGFKRSYEQGLALALVGPHKDLIISGTFSGIGGKAIRGIARWDGTDFQPMGDGLSLYGYSPYVMSILPYGDGCFVTGVFNASGTTTIHDLAWWDGTSFQEVGGGLDDSASSLIMEGKTLIVGGGSFLHAGSTTSIGFGEWDFDPADLKGQTSAAVVPMAVAQPRALPTAKAPIPDWAQALLERPIQAHTTPRKPTSRVARLQAEEAARQAAAH